MPLEVDWWIIKKNREKSSFSLFKWKKNQFNDSLKVIVSNVNSSKVWWDRERKIEFIYLWIELTIGWDLKNEVI